MIYFAQFPNGTIKIGSTGNVKRRMVQLVDLYDCPVVLLHTLPGDKFDETSLHDQFASLRFGKTEQFRPGPELMEFIGWPANAVVGIEASEVVERKKRRKQFIGFSLDPDSLEAIDDHMNERPWAFNNRSEALRDMIRSVVAMKKEAARG